MNYHEGSVSSENEDIEESQEESTSESEESTGTEGQTSETGDQSQDESTDSTLQDQDERQETELTEKGTKAAADPLSRANQDLANERAKNRQYEEVLNNPTLLKRYVAEFDKTGTQEQKESEKSAEPEIRVEDVQTTEDMHKYLRQQKDKVDAKVQELESTIKGIKSTQDSTSVANRVTSDISVVRETYEELNPKNAAYNPDLDRAVGELYEMFDFDPQTKSFKGQVSIKDIAEKVMRAAGISKKKGSVEAQTIIRDKRTGKANTGASSAAPDESSMTPSQLIASRMRAARGSRR